MSNLVIGYQNNVLVGTLAGSSNASGLDVSQLQNDQGNSSTAWQTTGVGTATLTISGLTGGKWRSFWLFRTNLTIAATMSVVVRNGGSAGTVVYSSGSFTGIVAGYGQIGIVAASEVTGDWCQITIADAGNSDGFFNIPLVYAGPVFQPIRNMTYASTTSRIASSVKATLRAGGVIIRNDWTARSYDCTFAGLRATELPTVRAIELVALQGNNILFVPDPASTTVTQEAIFGVLEPQGGVGYPYQFGDARGYRAIVTERL